MSVVSQIASGDPPGATPLADEDLAGLIPSWIATRDDLNAAEQANILAAMVWAVTRRRRWSVAEVLTRKTLADLHRRMFGDVWRWAGEWRVRDTNIGVAHYRVVTDLENLLADVRAQTNDPMKLAWPPDEVAIRFHHRLVLVHPFPNGNGRHARLASDMLAVALDRPRFSWGAEHDLVRDGRGRQRYLAALRTADHDYDYEPLLAFARS